MGYDFVEKSLNMMGCSCVIDGGMVFYCRSILDIFAHFVAKVHKNVIFLNKNP